MRLGGITLNQVLREEKKFLISQHEFIQKSHQLEQVLHQDPHNGVHGYSIRSLYFDTPFDDDFFEKQAGVELRRKIRLRIYDPLQNFAMLEMKQKQDVYQRKRSLRITREHAQRIIDGDLTPLLQYPEPFATELYGLMQYRCYRPKTIVEYKRKAFIAKENSIRITFDHDIISTESNMDLFSPALDMAPVMDLANVVLEVKFNGFLLGYIQDMLASIDKSELSVSKYVLARQNAYLTHL